MSHSPPKRRFIAGAVCPRCSKMDKMVIELESDARRCISCGFTEERPAAESTVAPAEVATRVSRAAARRTETPAEAVRLVDPAAPKD